MIVGAASGWPTLALRGGVESTGYDAIGGPIGIDLGAVVIPGSSTPTLTSEDANWARNALSFNSTPALNVWVSRLSPAIAVQSEATTLRLFNGSVSGDIFDGSRVQNRPTAPSFPKYAAYMTDGGTQIQSLGETPTALNAMSENWLLLWYGTNSHFVDTKTPTTYSGFGWATSTLPHSEAYQADAPLLLVFETPPDTVANPADGGVELTFASSAGLLTVQPLLGRDHPNVTETENWSAGLPAAVLERARWWRRRLCRYPVDVRETYAYERSSDTTIITESFDYLTLCTDGVTFAPLPPMLALSHDALQVTFTGAVVDAELPTEFGPTLGIENVSSYSWRVSQLNNFTDARRVVLDTGTAPAALRQALVAETDALLDVGHLAPWIFCDSIPSRDIRGDIYWHTPGAVLYPLVEVGEVLQDPQRSQLQTYLQAEQQAYPAEDVANLPLADGTPREPFALFGDRVFTDWQNRRPELFLDDVPLFNIYGLSRYHDFLSSTPPLETWQTTIGVLDNEMQEQDWATFYWFAGFDEQRIAVVNANRHLAGLIGVLRMANSMSDTEVEALARALFAKAAALRLGMARYPRYLYTADLVTLPPDPAWQPHYTAGKWSGFIFNYDWVDAYDDVRQVVTLDQHGVMLHDHSGFGPCDTGLCSPYLVAYRDVTPEVGRLLDYYVEEDAEIYLDKTKVRFPHWYTSFQEGMLGFEHNVSHPVDAYQLFTAQAWLEPPTPNDLAHYVDVPWLETGDLFYMHKLAEAIRAYRGSTWTNALALYGSPQVSAITLNWSVYSSIPSGATWRITYEGPAGDEPSPIEGLPGALRQYTLTGLTNFVPYTVTLTAVQDSSTLLTSNSATVVPRGAVYLPLVLRDS
jgi:hypothetical protein